jgi:hypothetical protein
MIISKTAWTNEFSAEQILTTREDYWLWSYPARFARSRKCGTGQLSWTNSRRQYAEE